MTSSPSRLQRKTENSRHADVQQDKSFHGDFHKMNDILIMLLMCVELAKILLLHKLNSYIILYKYLPVFVFLIDITYYANNIILKPCILYMITLSNCAG